MITQEVFDNNMGVSASERRRYPRAAVSLQVEFRLQSSDVPLRTQTTDVSLGGCYVEMPFTLEVGSKVEMVLWLGERKLNASGTVVTSHSQFGNGIEFTNMSSDGVNLLDRYLSAIADAPADEAARRRAI